MPRFHHLSRADTELLAVPTEANLVHNVVIFFKFSLAVLSDIAQHDYRIRIGLLSLI